MAASLNWWVIYVALPALTLALVPQLSLDPALWFLIVPQWLCLFGAWVVFSLLGKRLGWSPQRTGAVILVAGLCNTSFVGIPLLDALRGPQTLPYAVVADQLGSFAALSIGGALIVAQFSGGTSSPRAMVKKVVSFPPLFALLGGIVLGFVGDWPAPVHDMLMRIGSTLSPLALFSVGLRLRLRIMPEHAVPVALGLAWKLALLPLIVWGIGTLAHVSGPTFVVGVLEASMAPMISGAILAEREGLDAELANTTLAVGIVLGFATVSIVSHLLPT